MSNLNVDYLPVEVLEVGKSYYCLARNFTIGTWDGKEFQYTRYKMGQTFPDAEYHWDDGPPFGTVKPLVRYYGNESTD